MTLWEPKVDIMSWKRHILNIAAAMLMEQTAAVEPIVSRDTLGLRFISQGERISGIFNISSQHQRQE